jgi:protein TonB
LRDELARFCLPSANRDSNRKLAWINSICILFLLIGIFGSKPASIVIQPVPPLEEVIPVIIEPTPPPPQTVTVDQKQEQTEERTPEAPQVVIVTPESPNINFSVPTIGTLLVPNAIAEAPPLKPLQPLVARREPSELNNTGAGGQRAQPPYPKIALEQAEQGTVILLMTVDAAGNIVSIEVKTSSGYLILDRATLDYVRLHWTLPAGDGNRQFETSITYRLQTN